jgi:hypothetical protein
MRGKLMAEQDLDHAQLAKLLDGRLSPVERSAVLSHLAASDDAREVLADASAALAELAPDLSDRSNASAKRNLAFRFRGRAAMLAAAAVLVAIGVWTYGHEHRTSNAFDVPSSLALAITQTVGPPTPWSDEVWDVTRGPDVSLSESAKAVRIGALLVDLRLTLVPGDSSRTRLAGDLVRLLASYPTGSVVVPPVRRLAGEAGLTQTAAESLYTAAATGATTQASTAFVNAGAGLEAARLAVSRRDARFLRSGAAGRSLRAAAGGDSLVAVARTAVTALEERARTGGPVDWDRELHRLTDLLREIGG